ncbi:hypothetical protein ASE38_16960 [Cellulomonas sp. Root930]|nr:hypothetical protein ASE38_16960 [Cellulomonas sp. Root930]
MFGSTARYMKELATRLDMACPVWDARVMQFGPETAVVVNASAHTRDVYRLIDGQWAYVTVFTDADGEGHQLGPIQPIGTSAKETEKTAQRIVSTSVAAYRKALKLPDDDPYIFMRTAAELYLPFLTAGGR